MNIDPKELAMGIAAEKDHEYDKEKMLNPDDSLAKTIALRHLKEDPRYYTKLKAAGLDEETNEGALTPLEAGMAECGETPQVAIISVEEPTASQVPLSDLPSEPSSCTTREFWQARWPVDGTQLPRSRTSHALAHRGNIP